MWLFCFGCFVFVFVVVVVVIVVVVIHLVIGVVDPTNLPLKIG